MSVFDLFDSEYRQRRDINTLQQDSELTGDLVGRVRRELERERRRGDRLELVLESLVRVLQARKLLEPEELDLMCQRVDLADGVADGRMGPDRSVDAPHCGTCGRPFNPRRTDCLYCGAPAGPPPKAAPPTRIVRCVSCEREIAERDSWFSERGLLCGRCYSG